MRVSVNVINQINNTITEHRIGDAAENRYRLFPTTDAIASVDLCVPQSSWLFVSAHPTFLDD